MTNALTIAILAGAGAMLGWGLADFFAKKAITEIGDMASLMWAHVFGTAAFGVLLLLELFQGHAIHMPSGKNWLLLAFFGALQAAVYIFAYRSFGKGPVSILGSVFAAFPGITVLLSVLFFHESIGNPLPIIVIFIGIMLLSLDIGALKLRTIKLNNIPGLAEIGVATVLAALWTVLWDQLVGGQDWILFAFLMYAFMTIVIWAVGAVQKVRFGKVPHGVWIFLVLIGVCETVAYAAISAGYSVTTYTSVIAMVSGAFALPTIVLAWIFLKERMTTIQILGSVGIVIGIMLIPLA